MAEGVSLEEDLETFLSKLILTRLILKTRTTIAIFCFLSKPIDYIISILSSCITVYKCVLPSRKLSAHRSAPTHTVRISVMSS